MMEEMTKTNRRSRFRRKREESSGVEKEDRERWSQWTLQSVFLGTKDVVFPFLEGTSAENA